MGRQKVSMPFEKCDLTHPLKPSWCTCGTWSCTWNSPTVVNVETGPSAWSSAWCVGLEAFEVCNEPTNEMIMKRISLTKNRCIGLSARKSQENFILNATPLKAGSMLQRIWHSHPELHTMWSSASWAGPAVYRRKALIFHSSNPILRIFPSRWSDGKSLLSNDRNTFGFHRFDPYINWCMR